MLPQPTTSTRRDWTCVHRTCGAAAVDSQAPERRRDRPPRIEFGRAFWCLLSACHARSAPSLPDGGTTRRSTATSSPTPPGSRPKTCGSWPGPGSASCSTTRSRSSTSPKRSSTSPRGSRRRQTFPVGICGPIGPTEQLPLVARLVNALDLSLQHAHFWGMDEWVVDGREVAPVAPAVVRTRRPRAVLRPHPAGAADARRRTCTFPKADVTRLPRELERGRALRGDAGRPGRHQALGLQRSAAARGAIHRRRRRRRTSTSRSPTRMVDLHPHHHRAERAHQRRRQRHARADAGDDGRPGRDLAGGEGLDLARGQARQPVRAAADDADDLHSGWPTRPCRCPCSAEHPNVQFNFYRGGIGTCEVEMH